MKIVIVGLGVIGGSFAMALKKAGYDEIYGIDTNEETLQKAKRMGIIKGAGTTDELYEADLIILALYPRLIKTFIMNHGHRLKPGCVITDATGIKGMFIDDILEMLPSEVDFVFGHPMAGREKRGLILHLIRCLWGLIISLHQRKKSRKEYCTHRTARV